MDRPAPTGSGRVEAGFLELGINQMAAISPQRATGTLTRKTEPHQKWARSTPPRMGPRATPRPVVPDQIPMARTRSRSAVKMLVRIESVHGMRAAAPTPMTARARVRRSGLPDQAAKAEPAAEDHQPGHEDPLAADPVAQRPEGEEQAGEHHGVGVDHPLQLAGAGTQAAGDRREGHVENGVVQTDEEEGDAQHGQRGPPPAPWRPTPPSVGPVPPAHRRPTGWEPSGRHGSGPWISSGH